MVVPALRICFADRAALLQEFEANLRHGRAFLQGTYPVAALDDCSLQLVLSEQGELELRAQVVFIAGEPSPAVGLELRPFDHEIAQRVRSFVLGPELNLLAADAAPPDESPLEVASDREGDANAAQDDAPGDSSEAEADTRDDRAAEADTQEPDLDPGGTDLQQQPSRQERLRKLSQAQQLKMARSGSLNDRIMLERLYGRNVWEALLHNPKVTVPEVASIARKGALPRPLLEFIVENNTWISAPIVRRALLGNPRTSSEALLKLLRLTPKHELKAIHKTTTYSHQVRDAARKVLENA